MQNDINGEIVTTVFDYDGGRQVSVYVPKKPAEAIVYAGDGELISRWGSLLQDQDLPSTMIVGAHRTSAADEMVRIKEYSPDFDPQRFSAHEKFFIEDVRNWVNANFSIALPAERTAVCGVSASGELSLAMGIRHPDIFGAIFSASPGGGFRPSVEMQGILPRTYLVAGTEEPFFLENATRWADALRSGGADVMMTERHGDHGGPFWQEEFPFMVKWAFG